MTNVGKDVEKSESLNCCGECKLVQPLWKTVWIFLKELKIELLYDPAILLSISEGKKSTNLERHVHQCSQQHYL